MLRVLFLGFGLCALGGGANAQVPSTTAAILAEACFGCHGPKGQGATGGAAIAGRDKAELATALFAFRSSERPGTIMGRIARGYSDPEIAAIADHIARLR
ncbi:MAG: c-type cytochrome [bacterium]|jgi:sulfide dehydrogenase cytochrome subunit